MLFVIRFVWNGDLGSPISAVQNYDFSAKFPQKNG